MLSSSTTRRIVTAALVAAAVGPLSAATASAATVTRSDDTAADFSAGTPSSTVVRATGADGVVELARTLEEPFDGTVLPAGWVSTPWSASGAATVTGGAMLVDGTLVDSGVTAGPGSSIEFRQRSDSRLSPTSASRRASKSNRGRCSAPAPAAAAAASSSMHGRPMAPHQSTSRFRRSPRPIRTPTGSTGLRPASTTPSTVCLSPPTRSR